MTDRIWVCLLLSVALSLTPLTIDAEIYKWVDDKGNVTYSNRPPQPDEGRTIAPEGAPKPEAAPMPGIAPAPELKPLSVSPAPALDAGPVPSPLKEHDAKPAPLPPAIARTGPTKVDDLLELSGSRAQLAGLVRSLATEIRPAPGKMSAKDEAAVDRVLARTLRHETVYALVRDAFLPQVDRTNLEATAAFLRTPLARKIVALEIASSEPGVQQRVVEYAAALKATPPTERRVELIQRLDWATGSTEISADLIAAVARGITMAVSAAGPPEQRLRPGQIEDRVAQTRARANNGLREVQTASTMYAYRDLTDDELAAYVLFSGSEAGRWYNAAIRKAMVSALSRAVEQTASELVRAVPLDRWARAAAPPQPGVAPAQPADTPARPGVAPARPGVK
jgi:Domain of unknown function (DUF4124)